MNNIMTDHNTFTSDCAPETVASIGGGQFLGGMPSRPSAVRTGPSLTELREFSMPKIHADGALLEVEGGGHLRDEREDVLHQAVRQSGQNVA